MSNNELNKNVAESEQNQEQTLEQTSVAETKAQQPDALIKAKDKKVKENSKPNKKTKKSEKKQNTLAKKTKETVSELKKVSWPTFSKVVKQTGVVLAVVVIFAAVLFGIDRLLSLLFDLFTNAIV